MLLQKSQQGNNKKGQEETIFEKSEKLSEDWLKKSLEKDFPDTVIDNEKKEKKSSPA